MAKYISTEPLPVGVSEAEFQCERDGLTIRGTEYRRAGERLPIAVISHGIRAWQATVRHYAAALAELGYVAYTFDFCGGCAPGKGKSDGDSTDMSVLTEVEDLLRVIACAKSRPYTDPSRVLLMGCSQGGFVSAITAARLGEEVEALILLYPAQYDAAVAATYHLQILGIASVFVCVMLLTNAILQAHGQAKIPIITMFIGGAVKVVANYFLVGNPNINIKGAPIGTLVCYALITVLNLVIINRTLVNRPSYAQLFLKPFLATAGMR